MAANNLKLVKGELVGRGDTPAEIAALPPTTRLAKLKDVRRDLTKLYRAARKGEISSAELGRWSYNAGQLAVLFEKADVEERIINIEKRIDAIARKLAL